MLGAKRFLSKKFADHVVLKLDVQIAFNSIYWNEMLEATRDLDLTSFL